MRLFDENDSPQADPAPPPRIPRRSICSSDDGLADDMARVGLVAPIFQFWDRPTDSLVAEFDHAMLKNDTRHPFVVQCEQFKTSKLLLERVAKLANVEVLYGHAVTDVTPGRQLREPDRARP